MQVIDARDLAAWMLDLAERREAGSFNATGPIGQTTMGEMLGAAVEATASGAELVWRSDEQLRAVDAGPWMEVPLWAPMDEMPGAWRIGTARAQAAGLRCRPVAETVRDVWHWLREGGEAELTDWGSHARPAPMSAEREAELLGLDPDVQRLDRAVVERPVEEVRLAEGVLRGADLADAGGLELGRSGRARAPEQPQRRRRRTRGRPWAGTRRPRAR